jgi:hypothetical protein
MKDDVIVLMTTDGEEIEFVEIAGINLDGKFYAILQPVELIPGMEADEALVFSRERDADEDKYNIELDDEIIDKVFEEYYRLLSEMERNEENV